MEWWDGINLEFPQKDTMAVVLSALSDSDQLIQKLKCEFTDDNFIETQRLRDNVLIGIETGNIDTFDFRNSCRNLEKHNQCFEFFLQCISGQQQKKTKKFQFKTLLPLTVAEADKLSAAITSNNNIDYLGFFDNVLQDGMFHEEGTFEIIFEAVLNTATITQLSLYLNAASFRRIVERDCFGTSTLSNNVTLRNLILGTCEGGEIEQNIQQNIAYKDELMNQLTNCLKINKGLRSISFLGNLVTNVGCRHLLDSMEHNITLLNMDFSECTIENEEEKKERIVLQSKINALVQVNTFWNRCNRKNINARRGDKKWTNMDMLPVNVYPNLLLEALAKKPSLLFLLLQKKNPVLFDVISEQERRTQPRQRRSMRVLKKRRIAKEQTK
mmetsp:Transcript_42250/g.47038  ORF Transcript_42250/g.47038 Transcript_42250/m.47038 type:complete len:384 (+) Transcript_42250:102-1253(+)